MYAFGVCCRCIGRYTHIYCDFGCIKIRFIHRGGAMSNSTAYKLSAEQIAAIERAANRNIRVEIVPGKDGLKLLQVKRSELKSNPAENAV